MATTTCKYCGKEIGNTVHARHTKACIYRPERIESIRKALNYGDGTIKTREHYTESRGECIGVSVLLKALGTHNWEDVAKHFGLGYVRNFRPWRNKPEDVLAAMPPQAEPMTVCGMPIAGYSVREYVRIVSNDGVCIEVQRVVEERYMLR